MENVRGERRRIRLQQLLNGHDHYLLNLALVDDRVERVAHLVRNRRVDQTKQLSLCFRCIVEYLLGNVNECKHEFDGLVRLGLDYTLLDFEEFKRGHVVDVDIPHGIQVFDLVFEVKVFSNHFIDILATQGLVH